MSREDELAVLVEWLRVAVRSAHVSDWERRFAASMIARAWRGGWRPSPRQMEAMRRLVRDFRARVEPGGVVAE